MNANLFKPGDVIVEESFPEMTKHLVLDTIDPIFIRCFSSNGFTTSIHKESNSYTVVGHVDIDFLKYVIKGAIK